MKRLLFFLVIPMLFAACEIFEDYDERTYYDVEGVGYVYNEYTKKPVPQAIVSVSYSFESHGYATVQPGREEFQVDNTGCFRVKFLKRTHKSDVIGFSICACADNNQLIAPCISIAPETLKNLNSTTLTIDTLWLQ
ncbi:hypothetical protein FACS189413_19560 [Bacteroidia bacterium]|nr:hypothetical protein FACS189413_19560 [Bacteroidia bacterium]